MKIPQGITLTKFEDMSRAAARKIIALDCLRWLEFGKVSAVKGIYLGFEAKREEGNILVYKEGFCRDLNDLAEDENTPAHKVIEQMPEEAGCQVCALGLATIASICRFNEVTAYDIEATAYSIKEYLKKFFSIEQIFLMECAFEGWDAKILFTTPPEGASEKIASFFEKYPNGEERLAAIFQNIVDNEGEFVLPDVEIEEGPVDGDDEEDE